MPAGQFTQTNPRYKPAPKVNPHRAHLVEYHGTARRWYCLKEGCRVQMVKLPKGYIASTTKKFAVVLT